MKKQCIACGKESDAKNDFFDLFRLTGPATICKSCASEIGINNFFSAVLCSNIKALKKYVKMHPEAQFRLDKQLELVNQYKKEIKESFAALIKNYSQMSYEQLEKEMKKCIVSNPGLQLWRGEICFFSSDCCSVKFKDVVVGSTRTSVHVGGGKRMYFGTGTSQQVNNRQIVAEKYPGVFFLTNKRMVCNSVKLSFEIPLDKLTTMNFYSDGLTIMSDGITHNVAFEDVERLKTIIKLSNEFEKRKLQRFGVQEKTKSVETNGTISEMDVPKLLREYKTLHDDGIISTEEYEEKKQQLLSLVSAK